MNAAELSTEDKLILNSLTSMIFEKWDRTESSKINPLEYLQVDFFGLKDSNQKSIDTEKAVINYFQTLKEKNIALGEFLSIGELSSILPTELKHKFTIEEYDVVE